ncbi:TPA: hypothetical protein KSK08_003796 [Clostridioides difficile]|nr:hypothetical protein [Clostridioides difficile]HBH3615627.1 hypothetical protein [Clostridioides difficile]
MVLNFRKNVDWSIDIEPIISKYMWSKINNKKVGVSKSVLLVLGYFSTVSILVKERMFFRRFSWMIKSFG